MRNIVVDNVDDTDELSEGIGRNKKKSININRKRWIVVRNDTDVFCGLSRNYDFKPLDKIGDTTIKTYKSKRMALAGIRTSWRIPFDVPVEDDHINYKGDTYTAIEVTEVIR